MSGRLSQAIAGLGLLLITTMTLSGCAATSEAAVQADPARTITVVGRGEVTAKPDVAHTSIGIEVLAPTVGEAMEQARTRMTDVLDRLKAAGISQRDIQTSNFSINFERQMPEPMMAVEPATGEAQTPAGVYRVSNMVDVTIRDLDNVGAVLDAAVEAGANNVWGINFGLDDTSALEVEAREKAVQDAMARAESLAELNGVSLGSVVAVSEVVGNMPGPMYDTAAARGMGGGGTPVETGEVTYTTQIQVVYAIR